MFDPSGSSGRGNGPIGGLLQTLMGRLMQRGGGNSFGGWGNSNRSNMRGAGGGAPVPAPQPGQMRNMSEPFTDAASGQWFNRRPGPAQDENL